MTNAKELLEQIERLCSTLEQESNYSDEPLPIKICTDMPCIASPEEVSNLIKAGYRSALRTVLVKAIFGNRSEGIISTEDIPMVQIASDRKGCAMCKDGECLLWNSGLTPLMGKVHLMKRMTSKLMKLIISVTISQWAATCNASTVNFCLQEMDKNASGNHTN